MVYATRRVSNNERERAVPLSRPRITTFLGARAVTVPVGYVYLVRMKVNRFLSEKVSIESFMAM